MTADIVRLDLRLRRRVVVGTAAGVAVYGFVVVAMYPSFRTDSSLDALVGANPSMAAAFGISGSVTSPTGWLAANLYANVAPLLALLLTIGYGAGAVAGQEGDGLLGLVATLPVTRVGILAQKAVALLLVSLVVPTAALLVCLAGPAYQLTPHWGSLTAVTVAVALLGYDLGACALLVGALTASRGAATGVASGLAVVAYLVSSLAPAVHVLHPLRWLSPFAWAVGDDQLATGVTLLQWGLLVGLGGLLTAVAFPVLRRLDIH